MNILQRGPAVVLAPEDDGAGAGLSFEAALEQMGDDDAGTDDEPVDNSDEPTEDDNASDEPTAAADGDEEPAEEEGEADPEKDDKDKAKAKFDAPDDWDAEDREAFAEFDPYWQERFLAERARGDTQAAEAITAADNSRQEFEARATELTNVKTKAEEQLELSARLFTNRWEGIDWRAQYQADPEQADLAYKQMETEQAALVEMTKQRNQLAEREHTEFLQQEAVALRTIEPELVDRTKGAERRIAVAKHLVERGFPVERLKLMSAAEMSVAYDAMRWRELKTKATTPKAEDTAEASKRKRPPLRPGAPPQGNGKQRSTAKAEQTFGKSRSFDDALELMNSRSK